MRVLIDGREVDPREAGISVFDWTVQRGDGCFEAVRSYQGRLFRLGAHLRRLARSAALLDLPLPPLDRLEDWAERVAQAGGDTVVRIMVTRGGTDPLVEAPSRVVVQWEPVPRFPDGFRLLPVAAPWHPSGASWELAGAKSLSYAPNMAAQRLAQRSGYDDALLLGRDGQVLELPTSSIAWFSHDGLETPSLDLGILDSITRQVVLEEAELLGLAVREGRFPLERVAEADEALVMSTLKEVRPVLRVGELVFEPGSRTVKLAEAFRSRVHAEVG
ncbi:MAG: aminotransferase class IV [Actinomycetota bacterium]|nr:aminotransferase class IV [Actinomycetota bacterium]